MSRVRDLTKLGGTNTMDWLSDDAGDTHVRVPPGIVLTREQYREWVRRAKDGDEAQERYARSVATATAA